MRLNIGLIYAVMDDWKQAEKEYKQAVAISATSDLAGGRNDVEDALKKSNRGALKNALTLLQEAERQSIGFSR